MNKTMTFLVILLVVSVTVVFGYWIGTRTPRPMSDTSSDAVCAVSPTAVIASAQGDVYGGEETVTVSPDSHYLVYYEVSGNDIVSPEYVSSISSDLLDEQKDAVRQDQAWQIFTHLIPPEDRQMVVRFNIFTDGFENTLAAVDQQADDPSKWMLEFDIADLEDKDALLFTMIHEYAHLLTLNATQVIPDQAIVDDPLNYDLQLEKAAACSNYFTGTGCSYADSYINAFYDRFWLDIAPEWEPINALYFDNERQLEYYSLLHEFYLSHPGQFVDDYSVTHPTEDIAESFAYFVFSPKPTGNSIKEQKIAFFYGYPELVELREYILNGACTLER